MLTVGGVATVLDRLWPQAWAESWDNVGLLLGARDRPVHRCLCALDADAPSIEQAAAAGAELLLAHHPLPFRPLRRVLQEDPTGAAVLLAASRGVAVYAAHTNFDAHPDGVSRALADALGLRVEALLQISGREALYKLVVFVPAGQEQALLAALAAAGAGHLGNYSHCSFVAPGTGTFLPLAGARPFVGEVGVLERQSEVRLEVLVPERVRGEVTAALRRTHPYEEPAFDYLRLENEGPARGCGMVGTLPRRMPLASLARLCARRLGAPTTRFVGEPARPVYRVAVCGGAGMGFADAARRAGADVLVTADIRYHEAREAEAGGLALVDPGHQATEAPAVPVMAGALRAALRQGGHAVEVLEAPQRADVWRRP